MAIRAGAVTVRIVGLKEMARAAAAFGNGSWELLREHLLAAGDHVAGGVRGRYLTVNRAPDNRGAGGIDNQASIRGAYVVQTIRKSEFPGLRRPNYGPRMMRKAFLPAAWAGRNYTLLQAQMAIEEAKRIYWTTGGATIIT